jgi:hypothetical protein
MVRNVPVVAIQPEVRSGRIVQFFRLSPNVSEQVMMTILTTILIVAAIPEMLRLTFKTFGLLDEVVPEMPVGRIKLVGRLCRS